MEGPRCSHPWLLIGQLFFYLGHACMGTFDFVNTRIPCVSEICFPFNWLSSFSSLFLVSISFRGIKLLGKSNEKHDFHHPTFHSLFCSFRICFYTYLRGCNAGLLFPLTLRYFNQQPFILYSAYFVSVFT